LQSVHGLRCYGNITRTQSFSEYMLVLALYLVCFSGKGIIYRTTLNIIEYFHKYVR